MADKLDFSVFRCTSAFGMGKVFHGLTAYQATRVMTAEGAKPSFDSKHKPKGNRRVSATREFYAANVLPGGDRVRYTVVSEPALDPKKVEQDVLLGVGL